METRWGFGVREAMVTKDKEGDILLLNSESMGLRLILGEINLMFRTFSVIGFTVLKTSYQNGVIGKILLHPN